MTSKEKVLSVYPDATAYHTSDNYWTVLKTNTYPRVSIYPDGVQYTEAEAWEAAKNQLPFAPSPAGETASEEQCKHCDGPMPPLGAASMCPEHPHQPLSGMCESSGDDTVCSGCGEDAFYDNGDVTYACGCNRGWTLRRKFLMRKSDAVPEPVSPEGAAGSCSLHGAYRCIDHCPYCVSVPGPVSPGGAAKVYGFEEWWAKYLAGREINPFPDKASLWNAKQAAWSSWHAAVAEPPEAAAGSGLFDAWWIEHSRYGYAANEELAVAAWNAAVSSQTASAASPVAGVSADVSRIARQVVKRVVENAICSQWTRTLSALEADMDAEWPTEDDLVQDALALALGDDTGCLSEEDEDFREHIDVLWLEDILAAHFVLAQPSAEGDGNND